MKYKESKTEFRARLRAQHPERFLNKKEQTARAKAIQKHLSNAKEPNEQGKKDYQRKIGRAWND